MDTGVFTDKSNAPAETDLRKALGETFILWTGLKKFVADHCARAKEEWHYSTFGWSCRIKDRRRVIIYLLPFPLRFTASFVLGEKATREALDSDMGQHIKDIIANARVYAEGRGFRINVTNKKIAEDVKTLIRIKLSY